MRKLGWSLLLVCLVATQVFAETAARRPFLWSVESTGAKTSYVFGSIHLPNKEVTQLPPPVEKALKETDALYCEMAFDGENLAKVATAMLNGKPLSKVLSPDLYKRTDDTLKAISPLLSLKMLEKLEVWALATQLVILEEQMKDPTAPALDLLFYQRAMAAGKKVGGIETADEQLAAMRSFGEPEQIEMLKSTLDYMDAAHKKGQSSSAELMTAYLSGDLDVLAKCMNQSMSDYSPALRKRFESTLLTDRNRKMADRMLVKIRTQPDKAQFFVIGAAHFTGQGNVLELLNKDGVKVQRVGEK